MSEGSAKNMSHAARSQATRQDRLAAKLRENLQRRKAQARAIGDSDKPLPNPSLES